MILFNQYIIIHFDLLMHHQRKSIRIANELYHKILNHPFPTIENSSHNLIMSHILKKKLDHPMKLSI